jgi:putative pyruvate formate lyase activating enzyme
VNPSLLCNDCPRRCNADRANGQTGYCRNDHRYHISSIVVHRGEEPAIGGERGICNLFFTRCNLSCIHCQNYQISRRAETLCDRVMERDEVIRAIIDILDTGIDRIGFVSPSHMIPQVREIIGLVRQSGRNPVMVYNSGGYDSVDTLRSLETEIDVYLPDFKYMDSFLAKRLSDAGDYPDVAIRALREMVRQKGVRLITGEDGQALMGIVIRHLVLPGEVENSMKVLECIAGEFSPDIHLSLMAQYTPVPDVMNRAPLNRKLYRTEYRQVVQRMEELGFHRGWVQDFESARHYSPDFHLSDPFG